MSVFSVFKRGRQAAKEHTAKQAEQKKQEGVKTPYKHVPKHAAIDAMSSGPASSRDYDRPRIQEQNRKRNAMTANGTATPSFNGLPRVHSALSNVSYPASYATPIVQMPRSYSYSTTHLAEIRHSMVDFTSPGTLKGKGVERIMVDSGRASRSSSHASSTRRRASGSPTGSSNNSIASIEDLEIKPAAPHNPRRLSDPGRFSYPRHGIPPVPPLPPMQFDSAVGNPSLAVTPEEPLRSALSSRRASPTLVPETVEEEPSEGEYLEDVEETRKGKEVRFQGEVEAPAVSTLPAVSDEGDFSASQETIVPQQMQKGGKLKKTPSNGKRKARRWTLTKGKGVEVVV
ncbi:hypothetical protein QBC34DRAFT_82817 [Podospora aff. communis PSN243]|uniref:Uncharacterized protein n=1 Tax=Podospora aff. communis PSN243 TaxID=3040156 RepID=A0AAV9GMT0_9PEZI|nr:hypothetical protein QBC34DRAFT_82817 [Podospora aff. communis PSN243]